MMAKRARRGIEKKYRMGTSKKHFLGMQREAHGAQQPECKLWYMRIASTVQRSDAPHKVSF